MSGSITIKYRDEASGVDTPIEIPESHDVLGGQSSSMAFWSIPRIKEVGIERLSELGILDPVYFFGWEDMALLDREITLFRQNLSSIDFHLETKVLWLSHLVYCYHLLVEIAPKSSTPIFGIG